MNIPPRELLGNMFTAAVNAAQPEHCIPRFLPEPPKGRTIVIGEPQVGLDRALPFAQVAGQDAEPIRAAG